MKPAFLAAVVCVAWFSTQADSVSVPSYAVLSSRRIDGAGAFRVQVHVAVDDGLSKQQVASVIADVIARRPEMHAVSVAVMRRGELPGAYTVALGEWAPGGEWARASEGVADAARSTYATSFAYNHTYFKEKRSDWAAAYGLTLERARRMCGDLQTAALKADDAVFAQYPLGNEAESERLKAEALAKVAQRYGLTAEMAAEAWTRYHLEESGRQE